MKIMFALALALAFPFAQASDFLQGPEQVGHSRTLMGTVISLRAEPGKICYLMLADRGPGDLRGLGGGGRFFLCGKGLDLAVGQAWEGDAVQTGIRRARVGPHWRSLPLFEL